MKNKKFVYGGIGTGVIAICCFTPLLVIGLASIGLAGLTMYLDYVLFPLLFIFIGIMLLGIYQYKKAKNCDTSDTSDSLKE